MNNYTNKLIYLLFFFLNYSYAQTISGTVFDSIGNPIKANILIKDPNKKEVISEFIIAQKGIFSHKLKKEYSTNGLLLEATAIGYSTYEKFIKPIELKKNIDFNITLSKEKVEKLDEIFLESRKRPYAIKNDTVVYNVDSYSDGTERKVEDLLKKIPGIEISDDSNIIKYRGKSIETVTIEGDNLFDYNYSIGTKNINIDLVKEIEAIENYSENKLLTDIENSDKVILNLKLKENKTDLSVNTDIGLGDFPDASKTPINLSSNLLSINKKQKSFLVSTYNNVGENASPFNYSGNQFNLEQLKENQYLAKQIIPELYLPQVTKNNLSNINNQLFGNLNSVFTLSDKIKTKINLYYISDRVRSNQLSESNIRINNQEFYTFDNKLIEKKPIQYRGDIELKFNTSKTSLLEYNLSLRDESINTNASILSNQENDFRSFLQSINTFLKQNLDYTKKLSKKEALQIKITNTTNILGQNFNIQPSTLSSLAFGNDIQNNNTKKQNTSLKALLLGKGIKNNKYSIGFGFKLNNESFNSNLFSQDNTQIVTIDNGTNNLNYRKNVFYTNGSYNWRLGKFTITPNYALKYIDQILEKEFSLSKSNHFVFEPSITIAYKVDRTSFFNLTSGLNNNTSSLQYLFTNQILIDNRIVKKNTPNISLQKNKTINLFFSKNDLFNQLELYLGASYTKQKGNIFNNVSITENTTEIENFFLPKNTENIAFNLNFSKLITLLKTNVKLISNYSIFNFKNVVNNSGLRSNKSIFSSNSIFFKTVFNLPFNLENKTTYLLQETKNTSTFLNKSIENNLKLIFTPNKTISGTISYDYFIPSLKNKKNNYSFLNSELIFKPKNKNWLLNVSGVNLLNQNYFIQENTTDISNNAFRVNLLKRYFLINFTYSF